MNGKLSQDMSFVKQRILSNYSNVHGKTHRIRFEIPFVEPQTLLLNSSLIPNLFLFILFYPIQLSVLEESCSLFSCILFLYL